MAKQILLVDDSKTVLETVSMALEPLVEEGSVEFDAYLNPKELLWDLLEGRTRYDLLISDINMPQMNGLELINILKSEPRFYHKPILVLSTERSDAMKAKGRAAGVTGWITKPFQPHALLHAVRLVLGVQPNSSL